MQTRSAPTAEDPALAEWRNGALSHFDVLKRLPNALRLYQTISGMVVQTSHGSQVSLREAQRSLRLPGGYAHQVNRTAVPASGSVTPTLSTVSTNGNIIARCGEGVLFAEMERIAPVLSIARFVSRVRALAS